MSHKVLFIIESEWYFDNNTYSAVTIVEECNKAETGVGLSIASGNYTLNKICADFVIELIINKNLIIFIWLP